jgi:hypothetical protein
MARALGRLLGEGDVTEICREQDNADRESKKNPTQNAREQITARHKAKRRRASRTKRRSLKFQPFGGYFHVLESSAILGS